MNWWFASVQNHRSIYCVLAKCEADVYPILYQGVDIGYENQIFISSCNTSTPTMKKIEKNLKAGMFMDYFEQSSFVEIISRKDFLDNFCQHLLE